MLFKVWYQLWCYYETADEWKMEGIFESEKDAQARHTKLWDDVETPCMPDWFIQQVTASWK